MSQNFRLKDEYYMRLAINKAKQGIKKGQTPFGACIVKNGKVISLAHNTVWKNTDITSHAEMNAIRVACRKLRTIDLSGCVIYSTCEPCPMCFAACHWARISAVVFGARIVDAARAGFNELRIQSAAMKKLGRSRTRVRGGCLKPESLRLFKMWAKREGRKSY
jgi:tRNA(Arg) A34 adenosine deaminase TadA